MKKKLSLLLAAMLVMTLVPMSSFAAKTSTSNAFSVDYGLTGMAAEKSYVVEFDTELDTLTTDQSFRFDLGNAEFTDVSDVTVTATDAAGSAIALNEVVTVNGSVATIELDADVKGKIVVGFKVTTEDSDEGDVTLDIRNDLFGTTKAMVIGVVKEAATKEFSIVNVKDSKKTVSMAGGKLSQFEIKNYDKTTATTEADIVIEIDGKNAVLEAVEINGTEIAAVQGKVTIPGNSLSAASYIVAVPIIAADRRMELGTVDIMVTQGKNNVTTQIGEIVDYDVTLKVVENGKKEIATVVGGKTTTIKVTISGTKGSITPGRAYDINLDGATVAYDASGNLVNVKSVSGGVTADPIKDVKEAGKTDEVTVYGTSDTKMEFTAEIKVDATAKDGVATMTVSSRDIDEDLTADVAKVNQAYAVDTKITEVKRGESLDSADITITEEKVGQIAVGSYVAIKFNSKMYMNEKPSIEGTNGLKFDKVEWVKDGDNYVGIKAKVTAKSRGEAGEITFSGVTIDMASNAIHNRVYTASFLVGDKALTAAETTEFAEFDYGKCVAEYSRTAAKIVFTLGSANYTVDGVVKTLEAPVFTKDNRTMLPIGPLALALGLDVNYNGDTQTATFRDSFTGQVVSVKENATMLYNNGIEYKMHTAAVTVNGRIFVPVASITDAFGAKILWDEATQTVTIN